MKNIFKFILLLGILILNSCSKSNEDNGSSIGPANSLKKLSETVYGSTTTSFSANFNYENGKLTSITNATNSLELIYTGDKITSTQVFANNVLLNSYSLEYQNSLLISITNTTDNFERTFFTYNNSVISSIANQSLNNNVWQDEIKDDYQFLDNNIIQSIHNSYNNGSVLSSKKTYGYDSKLTPMNYMINEVRYLVAIQSCDFKNKNNQTNSYIYNTVSSSTPILENTFQTIYNSSNLPTSIKKYSDTGVLVSEATFEYN